MYIKSRHVIIKLVAHSIFYKFLFLKRKIMQVQCHMKWIWQIKSGRRDMYVLYHMMSYLYFISIKFEYFFLLFLSMKFIFNHNFLKFGSVITLFQNSMCLFISWTRKCHSPHAVGVAWKVNLTKNKIHERKWKWSNVMEITFILIRFSSHAFA